MRCSGLEKVRMNNVDTTAIKWRIIMTGPLPPAIGGMATVIDDLSRSSLVEKVDLELFDTAKKTPEKRSWVQAIKARLVLWNRWWRLNRERRPSIVHIHTCSGLTFFLDGALMLIARMCGNPVIMHIHGARFDEFLDRLPKAIFWFARWLMKRATRIVVLSEEWRERLTPRLSRSDLVVVPNGVPTPLISRNVGSTDRVLVLFLGNLGQRKGVWDIVAAAENLSPRGRIVLVGGEEDVGIGARVNEEIIRRGLGDRIAWAGPAVGEGKRAWLEQAEIFILPSYAEGLPISLLEAMCAGLAVVTTPVGAIPTVITNEEHGLLVNPGDIAELSAAINSLIEDSGLRLRLAANGRSRCIESYGIERTVTSLMDVYGSVI